MNLGLIFQPQTTYSTFWCSTSKACTLLYWHISLSLKVRTVFQGSIETWGGRARMGPQNPASVEKGGPPWMVRGWGWLGRYENSFSPSSLRESQSSGIPSGHLYHDSHSHWELSSLSTRGRPGCIISWFLWMRLKNIRAQIVIEILVTEQNFICSMLINLMGEPSPNVSIYQIITSYTLSILQPYVSITPQ